MLRLFGNADDERKPHEVFCEALFDPQGSHIRYALASIKRGSSDHQQSGWEALLGIGTNRLGRFHRVANGLQSPHTRIHIARECF